ncbi:hypothetical protein RchiOBHm_Chr2g0113731 [Rosa chinensis]|uniref:Uncharacterized protein n=1 Tax=Rosa chinensis TaxID=74649 RepID=A0A2P6RQI4_ROSCH|nr:hypothetical protein RchiOBHm_Chr2g0113731 [Rosa chinensis]
MQELGRGRMKPMIWRCRRSGLMQKFGANGDLGLLTVLMQELGLWLKLDGEQIRMENDLEIKVLLWVPKVNRWVW